MANRENQPSEPLREAGEPHREEGEGPRSPRREVQNLNETLRNIQNALGDLVRRVDLIQQQNPEGPLPPSPPRANNESSASVSHSRRREDSRSNPLSDRTPNMLHLLREFRRIKPPTFTGDDPQVEDPTSFLQEVERLLHILDCPVERYVELTSFQLNGTAKDWYDAYKTQKELEAQPLIWREFSDALKEAFMPHGLREEKAKEFEQLKQGNMSVMEYRAKFLSLARYATHIVSNPSRRVYRFVYGLKDSIARSVPVIETTTLEQAVSMAITAEARLLESEQRQNKKMKRADTQVENSTRRSNTRPKFQRSAPGAFSRGKNQSQEVRSERPQRSHSTHVTPFSSPLCGNCGKRHGGVCRANQLICYSCGQPGHYSRDCPNKVGSVVMSAAPVGSSAPTVNKGSGVRGNPGTGRGQGSTSRATARVFALNQQEAQATPDAITGTLPIGPSKARVIFDSGATRSFVSKHYILITRMAMEALPFSLIVTTPLEGHCESNQYVREYTVLINGVNFPADLILLDLL